MVSTTELQRLEREILEKLPRLLEEDGHFRVVIEGILAEKFPRRDEFRALVEEVKALRIESERRFEALQEQIEASRQESNRRFEAMDRRFEEEYQYHRDLKYSIELQLGDFQRRGGHMLKYMVAATLRLALDRRDIRTDGLVFRKKIEDASGMIGLPGKEYELDMWVYGDTVIFFKIKSVPEVEDVERFAEKCRLAGSLLGYAKYEKVIVSLDKAWEIVDACRKWGVRLV